MRAAPVVLLPWPFGLPAPGNRIAVPGKDDSRAETSFGRSQDPPHGSPR